MHDIGRRLGTRLVFSKIDGDQPVSLGKGHQRAGAANQRDRAWDKVNQSRYGSTPIAVFQAIGGILDESAGAV